MIILSDRKEYLSIFAQIFKMAKSKKSNSGIEVAEEVQTKQGIQHFFEKNQRNIMYAVGGVLALVLAYMAFQFLYQKPREKSASEQMWKAEYQFQRDSFALALENPGGGYYGFLDIIDNYGGTKAANLSKYYAGISYLNLNRFDDAINYLESFRAQNDLSSQSSTGALADAYAEKGDLSKALSLYKKASESNNEVLTPYYLSKFALLSSKQGNTAPALAAFKKIKELYPKSLEAGDVEKYIALLEN